MISLPIFSPGKIVIYDGYPLTIDFVTVCGIDLLITFKETDSRGLPIKAKSTKVECEPTIMFIDPDRRAKFNKQHRVPY